MGTLRVLGSVETQIITRDSYDLTYGIFDHENDLSRPLALVGTQPKEDINEYGALYRVVYQYNTYEISKNWGYTLTEFLELPREFVRLIFRISAENSARSLIPTETQLKNLKANQGL